MKKKNNYKLFPLGYKKIPDTNIFVNKNGRVWNNGIITIPEKILTPNGKISIEKAIEITFKPLSNENEGITNENEKIPTNRLKRISKNKTNQVLPQGYKKIPKTEYYMNNEGKAWRNGIVSNPQTVITQYGRVRTEKVVLWLYKGESPRNGNVIHLDGNKSNKSVQNLKYARLILPFEYEQINYDNLIIAIRSFCNIDRRENLQISNLSTRILLSRVFTCVSFTPSMDNNHYQIFKHWINNMLVNPKTLSELFKLSIRDIHVIRNHYLNEFTDYIVQLNRPQLPFTPTKRDQQKQLTEKLHSMGLKRPKKQSLKQSLKQLIKKWEISKESIDKFIEENKSTNNEPK